ncbi:flavodoxin family protein [Desulfogranum japonicum]|uniref:flavodoxin family protein n=1 Tax=Desulfogranum japonicum TaxID=231447 RepID=UPI000413F41D|nr:flavodoxin family protein [Desulfogranum japonicum]
MNVLIFNGSPRKDGNTEVLLQHVAEGIKKGGRKPEIIHLARLHIHPCTGCGNCETTGECIWDDDMQPFYIKIPVATRIVIGSPIYFYGVTAQTKAFIDRCQVFWSRKYLLGETNPNREARKGFLVCVAATSGAKIFDSAALTARYVYDAMDVTYSGDLFAQGIDEKGSIFTNKEKLKQAVTFGRELCEGP